jgi:transposase
VPRTTIIEMAPEEQAHILAALRRVRYGYVLALQILLLCAAQRSPTEIAAVLFCSRSPVYRVVKAYRAGPGAGLTAGERVGEAAEELGEPESRPRRLTMRAPVLTRSLLAILHSVPRLSGWCRTRWSCATSALELQARRGVVVSGETVRRWLHEIGWVWKRAKLRAKDDDPQRVEKLARIRYAFEQLRAGGALFFADELDISLLAKVGSQWMPKGEQVEVMTPGTNEKRHLAGALNITTGTIAHCVWYRKPTGLFLDLLQTLDRTYPARTFFHLQVVVDNAKIHQAAAVAKWLAAHPRFELLYLPTYCPQANPIERAFGDVHDKCTRNHTRKRIWHLVQDVKRHLQVNGPWRYALSEIYYTPEVTAAVQALRAAESAPEVISQLAA